MSESSPKTFWEELNIQMLPGEDLLFTGAPDRPAIFKAEIAAALVATVFSFGFWAMFLPFHFFAANRKAKLHQHYLTNRRVIIVNGVIGYTIQSIPLNRISDVTIECTWIERLLKVRKIKVKDLASQQVDLLSIREPVPLQEQLLLEVRRAASEMRDESTTPREPAQQDEVVGLLREIRDVLTKPTAP